MEITGKITKVLPIETLQNGKEKQEFLIETDGQYPKQVCLVAWNDMINNVPQSGTVTCSFILESREYNGRYYTSVTTYKIMKG